MKNKDKKMLLFVIATLVTSFGIGYTLLKGTQATSDVPANPAFDDINFYKCVVGAYNFKNDTDYDYTTYSLSDEQLQTITSLQCIPKSSEEKIKSSSGLEKLTELTRLILYGNQLTEIDLSNNTELTKLYLGINDATATAYDDMYGNLLTFVDLSKNLKLEKLSLANNQLTNIDVSKNIELTELILFNNQISELNIDANNKLEVLSLGFDYGCTSVNTSLDCGRSFGNNVSSLNLDNNTKLKKLYVSNNQLSIIDLNNHAELQEFQAGNNQLTSVNISSCTNLSILVLEDNKLGSVDLSNNNQLQALSIDGNQLKKMNLVNNLELTELHVSSNQLTELDIVNNTLLKLLDVSSNQLTELDLSKNTALTSLDVSSNQLTELDLSKNTALTKLDVSSNQLTKLDLSKNSGLTRLDVSSNQLTQLDVSDKTELSSLMSDLNPYGETLYVYKDENVKLTNQVRVPSQLGWDDPVWKSNDEDIAIVDDSGVISALKSGSVDIKGTVRGKYLNQGYTTTSTVNVVEITSDKYKIDTDNNYIFVGQDNDINVIKGNINKSHENVNVDIDLDNNKLYVKYDEEVLKEFKIIRISFNDLDVLNNSINVAGEVTYDEFVSAINVSDGITYKLYNGLEEVTSGNVLKDMVLKIYYNDEEIYEYVITDEYVNFDETLNVDKDKLVIEDILVDTMSDTVKGMIDSSGSIDFLDKDDNVLDTSRKLRTGDKFRVNLPNQTLIYSISINGDVNGDGVINRDDVMLSSKHIIKGNLIAGVEYLKAIDMDNNDSTNINDIIKMVKQVKVSE